MIKSERNKKNERDNVNWKLLMDKNMNKITDEGMKHLISFEKNDAELINQRKLTKDRAIHMRLKIAQKNIVSKNLLSF